MWVPPEDADPIVLQEPTRKSAAAFGAVRPSDGRLVARKAAKFNAETFQEFLGALLRHRRRRRKLLVVLDNASWHRAESLRRWAAERRDVLQMEYLPPYSPELNHQERVWKLTRRLVTHNQYFPDLEMLVQAVFEQFSFWEKPNNELRRLCSVT